MAKNIEGSVKMILYWRKLPLIFKLEILGTSVGSQFCLSHHDEGILLEVRKESRNGKFQTFWKYVFEGHTRWIKGQGPLVLAEI